MNDQLLHLLRSVFGYAQFRTPQAEVIATIMAGQDALVLMANRCASRSLRWRAPVPASWSRR
jgi:ATP-dependent DNA helicase RecQ